MFALPCERFGAYELNHKLGKGGMGEVWRATHRELRCERALKFPIERIAANRRWRAELLREARILVTLAHRNIATLFDFLDHEGRFAIVMEYVPGRTLAEVLREGPLPPRDAAAIMRQVGEALHYAHSLERPVIHRDLKPGNVMVRPDGLVKVLDWGLALTELESSGAETETPRAATTGGPILGTPGYMAPEQVRGKLADARADIWAFGCILFECLTGHRAFPRALEDLNATIADQPDLATLPAAAPARLRRLIEQCLRKDARERPQSVQAILADLVDDDSTSEFAPPTGVPHNLAPALTSFVGRARELDRIRRLLDDPQVRLLTLTGFGGCGKTRLALRVAEEAVQASTDQGRAASSPFPDGAWWIELASIADPALIPQAVAAAVSTGTQTDASGDPRAAMLSRLRDQQILLVLDNCEHLVAACRDLVADLLRQCPKLRVLATSREPLGVAGEQHVDVLPMATPPATARVDLDTLKQVDAVELFVRRVRLVQPDFELTESNAPLVTEICRRLDGIPFAIELAAARTRSLSLDQIAARLDNVFVLLKKAAPGGTRPHATLEATIRWSYDMLDASQRSLLDQLLVFQGGWTLEAAEAVCAVADPDGRDVAELLGDLVEKSLVVFEQVNGWPRYRMLEPVRLFLEHVVQLERVPRILMRRHAAYIAEWAATLTKQASGTDQVASVELLQNDCDNIRLAVRWLLSSTSADDVERTVRLASAVSWFCYIRGMTREGMQWLRAALERRNANDELQCKAYNALGNLAWRRGDEEEASSAWSAALRIAEVVQDQRLIAGARGNLALTEPSESRMRELEMTITRCEALADPNAVAAAQLNAAAEAIKLKQHQRAEGWLTMCLARFQLHDDVRLATVLQYLGLISRMRGDALKAKQQLCESMRLRLRLRDHVRIGETCILLGVLATDQGQFSEAAALFGFADASRRKYDGVLTVLTSGQYAPALDQVRSALSSDQMTACWTGGGALSEEQAATLAMSL